ncbi:MAG TPA: bifunctional DNA-formamidopyrimidine glycosylase/DNA-(apurinic or apyrimidinic site) lyase [Anaerolinea sp.]|nr:bifunctional DNA-formamidopyrimidine glycosylase/DNA-(apurinic or apyrimidinic site) lyase [Anaerolinea sp.]
MPELPEVETIVRALRSGGDAPRGGMSLPGRTIARANLYWERTLAEPLPAAFAARIAGQRILGIGRRAKFIVIHLDHDNLLVHLRMSGDLRMEAQQAEVQKHDRLSLDFTDGSRLAFNDARKFGRVWLVGDAEQVLGGLGPEPLDLGLTPDLFYERLQATKRQIKPLLLDQTFLAGMGNIYTDEALHLAKIHPLANAGSLSREQAGSLLEAIRAVLEEGIRRNGASIDWVYRGGDFQNNFRVYQRTGQPCPVCGRPVQRMVVGQRGTHFCAYCQQLERN